ncbi:MAG: glutaredoxin 3 [Lysobacteraceae bacterium]
MNTVTVYTSAFCGYCVAAKNFLRQRGLDFQEIRVDLDPQARQRMVETARRTSVPQIFVGEHHVGGFEDLVELERAGGLTPLLEQESGQTSSSFQS